MAYGYHVCPGCKRAVSRQGLRFPFACGCGVVARKPVFMVPDPVAERQMRPVIDLGEGGFRCRPAPTYDEPPEEF